MRGLVLTLSTPHLPPGRIDGPHPDGEALAGKVIPVVINPPSAREDIPPVGRERHGPHRTDPGGHSVSFLRYQYGDVGFAVQRNRLDHQFAIRQLYRIADYKHGRS